MAKMEGRFSREVVDKALGLAERISHYMGEIPSLTCVCLERVCITELQEQRCI